MSALQKFICWNLQLLIEDSFEKPSRVSGDVINVKWVRSRVVSPCNHNDVQFQFCCHGLPDRKFGGQNIADSI